MAVPAKRHYDKLLADISRLYDAARCAVVTTYWEIGQRIVEAEQGGKVKAPYGEKLIISLSDDLSKKYGKGFSVSNLENMRRFYVAHRKSQPVGILEWSKHVTLLTVGNVNARKRLEQEAIKKKLSRRALIELVRHERMRELEKKPCSPTGTLIAALSYTRGKVGVYGLVAEQGGGLAVDLGFRVRRSFPEAKLLRLKAADRIKVLKISYKKSVCTQNELFTYVARIEKIIDGDTFWVLIDLGFGLSIKQKIRLRGIDCPELVTPEGVRAKRFVVRRLKPGGIIIVKTYKDTSDKYDRYLADIFYLTEETDVRTIADTGTYLNQELLDNALAVPM